MGSDEGSDRFCVEVARALPEHTPVHVHLTTPPPESVESSRVRLARLRGVVAAARQVRPSRPRAAVYIPAARKVTVPALLWAAVLRGMLRVPVVMISFRPELPPWSRRLGRLVKPDLLLLTSQRECDEARRLGFKTDLIWNGADTRRFRPAEPGEKQALRRKWEVPASDFVVLHVGHLFENRNLRALLPLAAAPGVTVLLVTSSLRRQPESDLLERDLRDGGVVVLTGYQPEIEELYRLSDCYVFPTVIPTGAVASPVSVVEARASGLPVVARPFRALGEGIGEALGLHLVRSDEELVEQTLWLASAAPEVAPFPEDFTWSGVARRVVQLVDGLDA